MTTNTMSPATSPATLTIRFLINRSPLFVRSIAAPIYMNYQLDDDYACLRSITKALGPRELPYLYEAAEMAAEAHAAIDTLSADAEIPDELIRARLEQLDDRLAANDDDDPIVTAILASSKAGKPFTNVTMRTAGIAALRRHA